eukprot:CAMPEP_0114625824 /NCGR_PEP_ID=MMETSP0168-20121206/11464_1 /TAXON_ID=95228 ORGANISM="Vannella sp., Strain DIVA3 517/6/12" /NCGR_SAMPLE_ID=MMETSP0168 /ASSEMBLY_ACC=CAM_ASM_000044 /LENGTH=52 /DNA_ID=CAMNT_0001837107 /DNA_START=248 /DNA_END=403 /DNA_ORIENTATION=-
MTSVTSLSAAEHYCLQCSIAFSAHVHVVCSPAMTVSPSPPQASHPRQHRSFP